MFHLLWQIWTYILSLNFLGTKTLRCRISLKCCRRGAPPLGASPFNPLERAPFLAREVSRFSLETTESAGSDSSLLYLFFTVFKNWSRVDIQYVSFRLVLPTCKPRPLKINVGQRPHAFPYSCIGASQVVLVVKNPPANAGDVRDAGSIPESERSRGGRTWQPTPVFLPGESHGQRSLASYSLSGNTDSDTTAAA